MDNSFTQMLLHVLVKRWYVFVFLVSYLIIATDHWGFKRTLKFLAIGYAIAWASEASSIRTGFPYGFYYYHYDQLMGEPMIWGVPFWDSLSYVFLTFAGYQMALFLRARWNRFAPLPKLQRSWKTVPLGALLTMILDVVIDPVAHLGEQWFLGDIYHYPPGGAYFGVPISNFFGWFLVALAVLSIFRLTDSLKEVPKHTRSIWLGVGLYWGVFFFNLGVTFWIGAWRLGITSTLWGAILLSFSFIRGKQKLVLD